MKLFVFDHCPYCVKVMMLVGLKALPVERVYLQNHDVESRIAMVGANMVPILQKADGSFMAESLDIVSYLDNLDGKPVITLASQADAVSQWQEASGYFSSRLLYPRSVLLGLPEFGSQEAIAWFTQNKSAMIEMSFEKALAQTADYLEGLAKCWPRLDWLQLPSERGNKLNIDDINLFPGLRNLTMVKGLVFPARVRAYIEEVAALTQIDLYDDRVV